MYSIFAENTNVEMIEEVVKSASCEGIRIL